MERTDPSITPDEIREIRKRLGLSQVEAGELLGGGTRAFTKYETGTVKPRASVVRLLRVLEANPDAVASLKGGARPSASAANVLPFEVDGRAHRAANGFGPFRCFFAGCSAPRPRCTGCPSTAFTSRAALPLRTVVRTGASPGPTVPLIPRSCPLGSASSRSRQGRCRLLLQRTMS